MKTIELHIAVIRTDGGTQPRSENDDQLVRDYAEAISAGATMPPIKVFYDGVHHWLADGFHRLAAHRLLGLATISAVVTPGSCRDAVLWSFGANAEHGKRRSNEDKRRAVASMLADPEWSKWSDREIARQCKVSHPFVAKMRAARGSSGNVTTRRPLEAHPLAEAWPWMSDREFDGLVASIKRVGLIKPIVVLNDQVLDGRCRLAACDAAGVEPAFEQYQGPTDTGALIEYLVAANDLRQHLSDDQHAMVAARVALLLEEDGAA